MRIKVLKNKLNTTLFSRNNKNNELDGAFIFEENTSSKINFLSSALILSPIVLHVCR